MSRQARAFFFRLGAKRFPMLRGNLIEHGLFGPMGPVRGGKGQECGLSAQLFRLFGMVSSSGPVFRFLFECRSVWIAASALTSRKFIVLIESLNCMILFSSAARITMSPVVNPGTPVVHLVKLNRTLAAVEKAIANGSLKALKS